MFCESKVKQKVQNVLQNHPLNTVHLPTAKVVFPGMFLRHIKKNCTGREDMGSTSILQEKQKLNMWMRVYVHVLTTVTMAAYIEITRQTEAANHSNRQKV